MEYSKQEVENVVRVLSEGGIILYPTDILWGLGCDAGNSEAVEKLGRIRGGRKEPYILALDNDGRLYNYFDRIPDMAWDIIELSERPTTLILPGAKNLAPEVITADGSAAVRVIKDSFVASVIRKFGKAIISTSANLTGEDAPSSFDSISQSIKTQVDYIVDYRKTEAFNSKPLAMIKLGLNGEVKVIR